MYSSNSLFDSIVNGIRLSCKIYTALWALIRFIVKGIISVVTHCVDLAKKKQNLKDFED